MVGHLQGRQGCPGQHAGAGQHQNVGDQEWGTAAGHLISGKIAY